MKKETEAEAGWIIEIITNLDLSNELSYDLVTGSVSMAGPEPGTKLITTNEINIVPVDHRHKCISCKEEHAIVLGLRVAPIGEYEMYICGDCEHKAGDKYRDVFAWTRKQILAYSEASGDRNKIRQQYLTGPFPVPKV